MRKHFLLLFLMALLPLAGWAAVGDVVWDAAPIATYDAVEHTLPVPSVEGYTDEIVDIAWVYTAVGETTPAAFTTAKFKNAGTYKVTFKRNVVESPTYEKSFTVAKKTLTITAKSFTGANSIIYGSPAPENDYVVTGWPTALNTDAKKTTEWNANVTGNVDYTCDYDPADNAHNGVGNYTITPIVVGEGRLASNNYSFSPATGTLTVVAKPLADDATKFTYAISTLTYNATAQEPTITVTDIALNQPATFATAFYTDEACTTPFAGSAAVYYTKAQLAGVVSDVEDLANDDTAIGADNAAAINAVQNTTYTAATKRGEIVDFGTFKTTVTALPDGDTGYVKIAAVASNHTAAATYWVKITGTGNYGGDAIKKSFKINQKPLAITTVDNQATYNGEVQTLNYGVATVVFEGLEDADKDGTTPALPAAAAFADNVSIKVKTAQQVKYVGTGSAYTIQAYAVKTVGTDVTNVNDVTKIFKNYQVAYFNDGKLTINPKELTFTLKDQEINYGVESDLEIGGTYIPTATDAAEYLTVTGLATGDAIATYPTLTVASTEKTEGSSTYAITTNPATMTFQTGVDPNITAVAANNYTFAAASVTASTLTVIKGNISARPINAEMVYGGSKPELTVNVSTANETDKATAAAVLKDAIVIANVANDAVTTYPNAGTYTMTLDFNLVKDNTQYKNLIKNYNITAFTGTFTIAKRDLTLIEIEDQTVAKDADIATALDKDLVTFTAAGGYDLTDYDKATLKAEFEYVLKTGTTTASLATDGVADAIRIAAAAGFKNFRLPADVTLGADGEKVDDKYLPGKLYVVPSVASAIVLQPVKKAVWTAASEATRKTYGQNAINNADGKVATVKFGDFAMTAERWYTMVLPFETSVAEVSQKLGYAVVDVLDTDNSTASAVKFKLHMQEIAAGQPFLVKVYKNINLGDKNMDGTTDDPVTFANKLISKTLANDKNSDESVQFIGTYLGVNSSATNEFYMAISDGKWYQAGYTRPTGAYVKTTSTQEAPMFYIEEADGSTTAISAITADGELIPAQGWYTINGVKLQGMPTEKGIYINNGKKVVLK